MTPTKWYFDISDRVLRDSNGVRIRNDDRRPFATLSQKFRANIQVVKNSSLDAYTGWDAGTTFRFTVDDDYSNPPPYLPLYGNSSASWTSGTGSEYYYVGETISSKPSEVQINGSVASEGTVGSLAAGEWGWNTSNGLYVHLSDDADPDTKADGYVSQRPSGTYTQPFLYVDDSSIQQAGTWEDGSNPDITQGQLSLLINANRTAFYERLGSNSSVRCMAQIHILNSSNEFIEMISFRFIAKNIMLGDAPFLELDVYPYYTKGESDLRYALNSETFSEWEASDKSTMTALSDATPGDVCLRTDEALFRKLKAGGTYSTASDWRQVILANEDDELVGPVINRTGTDAELTGVVLNEGEWAYATDAKVTKMGDGSTAWENLDPQATKAGTIATVDSTGSNADRGTALYNALNGKTSGTVFVVGGLDYALPNDVTLEGTTNLIVLGAERGFRAYLTGNAVILDTSGICRGFDWTDSITATSFKDGSMPVVFSQGGFDTTKAGTIVYCTTGECGHSEWSGYECAYDLDTCIIGNYFCDHGAMSGDIYGNCVIGDDFCYYAAMSGNIYGNCTIGDGFCDNGTMSGSIYGNCTIGEDSCRDSTMSGNIYGNCTIGFEFCANGTMSGNIYGNCTIGGSFCSVNTMSGNIYGSCVISDLFAGFQDPTISGNIYNSVFPDNSASAVNGILSGGAYYNCVDKNGVIFSSVEHADLKVKEDIQQAPLSSDPTDPDDGYTKQWVSDGTGSGNAGDVMMKINVSGTVKTTKLVDYSTL